MIFRYFAVPRRYQHEVLLWGVVGALVMRGVFIVVGIKLLNAFSWIIYIFGAILIYSGIKLFRQEEAEINPEANVVLRWFRKLFRVTKDYEGEKFFVVRQGIRYATPLAVVLVMIETTDLLFATDSIPAVFAVTREPFIVFTSNVFAILGLRSLYFALAGMIEVFHLLHYGLSVILIFIGVKMLASGFVHIPIGWALGRGGRSAGDFDCVFAVVSQEIRSSRLRLAKLPPLFEGNGIAASHGVLSELAVVAQGKIEPVMRATAFFAGQSRAGNQQPGLQNVGRFVRICGLRTGVPMPSCRLIL